MIDISPEYLQLVKDILKQHVPQCEVRAFGSRHNWVAKPYSDLDIAIVGNDRLAKKQIYDLQEAFEESILPFRVDVLDWWAISDEFRAIIEQGYSVIQEVKDKLPAGWVVKKLGEVTHCYDKLRKPLSSMQREHRKGIYPYYGAQGVIDHIDDYVFDGKYILIAEDGENLRSRKQPVANIAKGKFWVNNHAHVLQNNTNSDFNFIYYYLNLIDISPFITGAAQPKLNQDNLFKIDIVLPPLAEQQEIAAILSSLDDKIELNQQINKKLEEMAQAIFKQWFIDFNFPDENGNPYRDSGGAMIDSELGLIPSSWSVGKLCNEFKIIMGQSPAGSSYNENQEGMIFYQGRTDFGVRFPSIRLFTSEPKRIAKQFDILLSVRAPVGDINIALQDCCIGRGLAAISAENRSYCYYTLQSLKSQFDIYNGTGTVFGAINKDQLNGLNIVIPNSEVIKLFESIVSHIGGKIHNNHLEIINLQNTRDTLLPKIMSGNTILDKAN